MERRQMLLGSVTIACLAGSPIAARAVDQVKVVTSITILGDMVKEIGGRQVTVRNLVGPDGDAHGFEPTPADAKAIAGADLVVVNGLGLEGWIDRLIASSGYRGPVITASTGVSPREFEEEGKTVPDPHAWQDLKNGRLYVQNIAEALEAADPSHADGYRQAAERHFAQIDSTDAWVRQEFAGVPEDRRKVISSHDAFGYFGAAYGIEFVAPQGISEDAQPSAADMKRLIDQIRREHIQVLFFENALNPRLVRQIGRETGAKIGGTLYADSLSRPGGSADSYLGMFRHNVPLLKAAMVPSS